VIAIDVHLDADTTAMMARDVRAGLSAWPKELAPKWFYDERGSQLFERITALEEYYPTRAERGILTSRAAEIVAAAGSPRTLIELGSGSAAKTRHLLDAMPAASRSTRRSTSPRRSPRKPPRRWSRSTPGSTFMASSATSSGTWSGFPTRWRRG
jgi:uncharacterized SAM-dependent methyltransferase